MVRSEERSQTEERCSGCGQRFSAEILLKHLLCCPAWAGDGEPDWGCQTCMLVWIGPMGKVCQRCFGDEIGSFW